VKYWDNTFKQANKSLPTSYQIHSHHIIIYTTSQIHNLISKEEHDVWLHGREDKGAIYVYGSVHHNIYSMK